MSSRARTWILPALLGIAAGPLSFPADLVAQAESGRPSGSPAPRGQDPHGIRACLPTDCLGAWIEEARASPFHDPTVFGIPANPAAESAIDESVGLPDMIRQLLTSPAGLSDSVVSGEKVFAYTSVAAFVPMVPALIKSGSNSMGDLAWFVLGGVVTLVSVPVAAMAAGTTSAPWTAFGAATGFLAGAAFGGAFASGLGDYWFVPVYSVTMAFVTAAIAR